MGLPGGSTAAAAAGGNELSPADWVQVVIVAGIGSVLEWLGKRWYAPVNLSVCTCGMPQAALNGGSDVGSAYAWHAAGLLLLGAFARTAWVPYQHRCHPPLSARADFFNYSLLDGTLKEVFFTTETGYWCAARRPAVHTSCASQA